MRWSERKDKRGKRVTNTEREGEGQKEIKSTRRIIDTLFIGLWSIT